MTAVLLILSWVLAWAVIIGSLSRAPDEEELWGNGTGTDDPNNDPDREPHDKM